ncbi:hypothetical protein [Vulcanococcus limneticus]|uniref:hypothetical protein n=1 Tax=Vulcanococcus limneticus TaxID=2170428 RepID=UPI00398BE57D
MEANATVLRGDDCGYAEFTASVDVLITRRHTYDQVTGFDLWPCAGNRVVMFNSRPIALSHGPGIQLHASSEPPADLLRRLSSEGSSMPTWMLAR